MATLYWQSVKKNYVTFGGDPYWICPNCNDEKSQHVYGIEHMNNYTSKCPVCGIELKYPNETKWS